MSLALDDVCQVFGVYNSEPIREMIAKKIIALAQEGERSRTRLRDSVLKMAGAEYKAVA